MRITIPAVVVDGITCTEGEASLSVSTSVALRVVPVDADGIEYPAATITVVGNSGSEDIAQLVSTVKDAVETVITERSVS